MRRINTLGGQGARVDNLACLINEDSLKRIHKDMDPHKALGVDKVSKENYGIQLDKNTAKCIRQLKSGAYKPQSTRRTYIEKPGSNKMRPLGISCYEDKLVEANVAEILNAVYEPRFCDNSYGFRPERNCQRALTELVKHICKDSVNYVVEADIRSFFDTVDHGWMLKFLEHDIADRKFIDIIRKQLETGVMEDGKVLSHETGTVQGSGASPVLANIYLHYVLDIWFERTVKRNIRGSAYLIRYADDFVCCFQYKEDAERFYAALPKRFAKFKLTLAEEKTRILEFGRYAIKNRAKRGEGRPETFDFLGFTLYCCRTKWGTCRVYLKSNAKRMRTKLLKISKWMKEKRTTLRATEYVKKLNRVLVGYYNYYAVKYNSRMIWEFRYRTVMLLFKWLNKRSQRRSYNWDEFNMLLSHCPIVKPVKYWDVYAGV